MMDGPGRPWFFKVSGLRAVLMWIEIFMACFIL